MTPRAALTDGALALGWVMRGVLAQADPTARPGLSTHLTYSRGRSRTGTGARYILVIDPAPDGVGAAAYHRFKAHSDADALTRAEAYLAKHSPNAGEE